MLDSRPTLVNRHRPGWLEGPAQVADFSQEKRPAYRVACHCRNCNWRGEARIPVGEKIPMWLLCPTCETAELSAHGEFLGRDEVSRKEERERVRAALEEMRQERERLRRA
jgi:hypothetical protein